MAVVIVDDTDDNNSSAEASSELQYYFPRRRPLFKRTRTGCLTCRQRRKKCDETKPQCTGCTRNFLTCTWPAAVPALRQQRQQQEGLQGSKFNVPPKTLNSEWVTTGNKADTTAVELSEKDANEEKPLVRSSSSQQSLLLNRVCYGVSQPSACFLTPSSPGLVQHYASETGVLLAAVPANQNAFISYVLPLAYVDSLLMNTVLCLSAAHLTCRQDDQNMDLERTTWTHYAVVIQGLRDEVRDFRIEDPRKTLRLLLTLIIMCHVEAVSGNTSGTMFHHLRACRQLLQSLLNSKPKLSHDDRDLLGFILELYAYMVLANSFTPYGLLKQRTVPYDSLVMSLDYLHEYRTFGIMFAGGHGLFELIPRVSLLFQRRLAEEAAGVPLVSSSCHAIQRLLYEQIENWRPPPAAEDDDAYDDRDQRITTAEVFRHALHIYLATAMCGSVVTDPVIRAAIQARITTMADLVLQTFDDVHATTLLWPALIGGSCMVDPAQRAFLEGQLGVNRFRMRHSVLASRLLRLLWDEAAAAATSKDPGMAYHHYYGPYGLCVVMRKYGLEAFCTL